MRLVTAAALVLVVGGCEGIRQQLGLNKQAPDEFRVVARAPLTLPPDFTLRPPKPGLPRPQEGSPTQQARKAVFRAEPDQPPAVPVAAVTPDTRSPGEVSLLKAAGADKVDPQIRMLINRETAELNAADEDFLEFLVFWRQKDPYGEVIDPIAESKRLREVTALGKDITAGQTPTIKRRRKALFEGIF
ncbi:MAG: DUF3035 domain-containing protein [Alphaproteobacteria bacterium]|nr:MAG: DUF3035 domain-containing protein [Alphaproteobacteria bacterium]